jgi:hypothetical protein
MATTYQETESLIRYSSKVPAFQIESSDPADTATGVPVSKTISLTMSTCFIFSGSNCKTIVSSCSSLMYLLSAFHSSAFESRFRLAVSDISWIAIFLSHLLL